MRKKLLCVLIFLFFSGVLHVATADAVDIKELCKSAEQGDAESQVSLGILYQTGEGTEQDYQEAMKWYLKAAEQGNVEAQYRLGSMYYNGDGVDYDDKEAIKWFRKAAEQGHAEAQLFLGSIYHSGDEVEPDYQEAIKWYTRSAKQGNAEAQYYLGAMYYNGDGVDQDMAEAEKWLSKAAQQGNTEAKKILADLRKKSEGIIDIVRNRMFYEDYPADVGYFPVGEQLERCFSDGKWNEENDKELGTLAVFQGIGRYSGRRAKFTVKFARLSNGNLVIYSIHENKNRLYFYAVDRGFYQTPESRLQFGVYQEMLKIYGMSQENKISLGEFLHSIYSE